MAKDFNGDTMILDNQLIKKKKYWLKKLSGELVNSSFSFDFNKQDQYEEKKNIVKFTISNELFLKLNKLSNGSDTRTDMILSTVLILLINKYTNNKDIIIGKPVYKQNTQEKFISTMLTLRNQVNEDNTFKQELLNFRQTLSEATEHQNYPIHKLFYQMTKEHKNKLLPYFDIIIMLENIHDRDYIKDTKVNTIFSFVKNNEYVEGTIEYNEMLYKQDTIEKIAVHFINLLEIVLNDVGVFIKDIDILSKDEKHKLLYEFNETCVDYPRDKTIQELFEEQVVRTPDNIAVVFEDESLTYRELNQSSNRVAKTLREKGVVPDCIVAIMVDRSLEMIVGIMGILKAGGAYLPIDPEHPKERIEYMLEDSNVNILLTQTHLMDKIKFGGRVVNLDNKRLYEGDKGNLKMTNKPSDLAYVIYTSGSTGKPKGVLIEHINVVNLVFALSNVVYSKYNAALKIALVAPYIFDASVQQIFPCLLLGHKLFIVPEEVRRDGNELLRYYNEYSIDISDGTPMHLSILANTNNQKEQMNVKHFIIGGDVLLPKVVEAFYEKVVIDNTIITNVYGPTECCVDSIAYQIDTRINKELHTIPIGRPIANTSIYILDEYGKHIIVGGVGEIYIAGDCVGRGYLNQPQLTKEKFMMNPFVKGEKIYKTGDLAKWLPDGNIEFIGRIDQQVKIRGFRIELGEIENQLLKQEGIKEAVVIDREDKQGDKYLCAYIVCDREMTVPELSEGLLKELPEYMIPSYFVQLDKVQLTSNGKIDRKALPEPDEKVVIATEYEAARNEVEEKLVAIWKEVLGVNRVGINDEFFELGGHSLKAIMLVAKVHKAFNVEVPLKEIFKTPTVSELAQYIQNRKFEVYCPIDPVEERTYYPVSSAERRMFTLNQFERESTGYNMPGAIKIQGLLDKEKLEGTFKRLIKRHSTLRTSFEMINEAIVQKIHGEVEFKVEYVECEEDKAQIITGEFIKPFDLSRAPLLRVKLICTGKEQYVLLFDMHHIISDGVSMELLIKEFALLYGGAELPPLKVEYKDYSVWQQSLLEKDITKIHEKYWIDQLSGELPVLNLPTDYTRPSMKRFEGNRVSFYLGREVTEKLKEVAGTVHATTYMVLLAAYNVLLSKYSGQEDIIIGSPIAGRNHADLQNVIGLFVNTLAIRSVVTGEKTFLEFLEEVRENAIEAYEHEHYQFEELVEKLEIRRDISRNPIFDTVFVMKSGEEEQIELDEITFLPYQLEEKVAKFDLTLSAIEQQGGLYMDIEYSTYLFKRKTIERMKVHFLNIIKAIIANRNIKISEISMISEQEEKMLLSLLDNREVEYPKNKTIEKLFEEQVEKVPDNIAVVYEEQRITYKELNEKANQLAYKLREKGVKKDSIVGIHLERSIEIIIGMMGILKAGGAYLPIDPTYPKERIEYMIKDSKINILLTACSLSEQIEFEGQKICLDEEGTYCGKKINPISINNSEDLAYIIYTSGSTGKPKGAMIEHKNVVRLMKNDNKIFDFTEKDTWTMFHSMCFDFSVWEVYGALLYGGKLVIVKKNVAQNAMEYLQLLNKEKVTVLNQTPTAFYNLCSEEEKALKKELTIRYIIFGGEALKPGMLKGWREKYPETKLINMYGITETTVHVTFKEIKEQEIEANISNIGKPIPTLSMYIMDKNMKLQPIGVPGEICVGGEGVGRGYLNRAELTEEKFVSNPYRKEERIYRSGDLARLLSNGELEYLGRIDHQVKIRGFRIELGEIENNLLKLEGVNEAIVIDREENGNKYLCAYFVGDKDYKVGELRNELKKNLPEYMMPSYYVKIDNMPLNSNGKLDKKCLPKPSGRILLETKHKAPRNEIEIFLVEILSKILLVDKIGVNDNLFEIGANSLDIIKFAQRIKNRYEIDYNYIFQYPYISEIAQKVKVRKDDIKTTIEKMKLSNQQYHYNDHSEYEYYIKNCYQEYKIRVDKEYDQIDLSKVKIYNNILLTGATGYLGMYLLFEVLKTTKSRLALIIRGKDLAESKSKLIEKFEFYFGKDTYNQYDNRIYILNGDLSKEMLGLDKGNYLELSNEIDCIINCAADVRHFGAYKQFYESNVRTTDNLLKFCANGKKQDFFHISTLSVGSGLIKDKKIQVYTEYDGFIEQKTTSSYTNTKIEAEKLVLDARNKNIKTTIFRIGNIVFNSNTGQCQKNINDNAFYQTIKSLIKLKVFPNIPNKIIELSFVDLVSKSIILLFNRVSLENEIFHINNPNKMTLKEFAELSKNSKLKDRFQFLDVNDFLDHIIKNYDNELLKEAIDTLFLHTGILNEENQTEFNIYSDKTEFILDRLGFRWENIKEEHIEKMINYACDIGFWDN